MSSQDTQKEKSSSTPYNSREFWDGRAEEFSEYAATTGYSDQFIALMKVTPDLSVLDLGCGGGTICVPLAPKVQSITAVDFSPKMLEIVQHRCNSKGITNVKTCNCAWEEDWEKAGIGVHDVAIASRSLMGENFKVLVEKLDRKARKAVYISSLVGDGPFDKALFESTGRKLNLGNDYIFYYNSLYEMGIRANVAFCREDHVNSWSSFEEAFNDQLWMFQGMTRDEEESVREYLKKKLSRSQDGRLTLPYSRTCYWAVMWWNKEE